MVVVDSAFRGKPGEATVWFSASNGPSTVASLSSSDVKDDTMGARRWATTTSSGATHSSGFSPSGFP